MSDHPKCIDISHWQGFPNFAQVKAAGVIAMIHKCTEGTSYTDPNRRTNCSNAIKAGIAVATYHWLSPGSDPEAQMRHYLDELQPVVGERVIIDYEENGCTLDQLHAAVEYLIADPRNLEVTVYSGHLLKEQLNGSHDSCLAENTDLWLAQYTTGEPSWSEGTYHQWMLWQYSESGNVDGIEGSAVDLNRFNGSDEELLAWISPAGEPMPVPPDEDTITGKVSWFGGPDDDGVDDDEGLAFIYDIEDKPELFLPIQPEDTTGLARRLNPNVHYIAMRWNYNQVSKEELLSLKALVRNPKTDFALTAFPADWGPHESTGRIADLSPGLMADLGLETDDEVEVIFPYTED